jgi:hypothetical protein
MRKCGDRLMKREQHSDRTWIPMNDVCMMTGKSSEEIRAIVERGSGIQAKKVIDNDHELWLIHKDTVKRINDGDIDSLCCQYLEGAEKKRASSSLDDQVIGIVTEVYEKQRKELMRERDQALQGLMMYRYKYEELDRQFRLLPAPPDMVKSRMEDLKRSQQEKDEALVRAQEILKKAHAAYGQYKASMCQLKAKLAEEERAKEAYRIQWELAQGELELPWWKRLFGRK